MTLRLGSQRYGRRDNAEVKRRAEWRGLPVSVEIEVGDTKSGKDELGNAWSHEYKFAYGELPKTHALSDGDPVDVYLGNSPESEFVFVVHQLRRDGSYDEDKCFLDFPDAAAAEAAYREHGPEWGFGSMDQMTVEEFVNGYLASNRVIENDVNWKPTQTFQTKRGEVRLEHGYASNKYGDNLSRVEWTVVDSSGWAERFSSEKKALEYIKSISNSKPLGKVVAQQDAESGDWRVSLPDGDIQWAATKSGVTTLVKMWAKKNTGNEDITTFELEWRPLKNSSETSCDHAEIDSTLLGPGTASRRYDCAFCGMRFSSDEAKRRESLGLSKIMKSQVRPWENSETDPSTPDEVYVFRKYRDEYDVLRKAGYSHTESVRKVVRAHAS